MTTLRAVLGSHSSRPSARFAGAIQLESYVISACSSRRPASYTGMDQFAQAIGRQPNIALYYNAWLKPFQVGFAASAAKRGAVTLVQIDATNTSLASIASGRYDSYWRSYANEVKTFGGRVILSFDHEMNGDWYPWGYRHESPCCIRSSMAAYRNHLPQARSDERHLAVDNQHNRHALTAFQNRHPGGLATHM